MIEAHVGADTSGLMKLMIQLTRFAHDGKHAALKSAGAFADSKLLELKRTHDLFSTLLLDLEVDRN